MNNFHPLEVVDRDSETQLEVGDFFICSALMVKVNTRRQIKNDQPGSYDFWRFLRQF